MNTDKLKGTLGCVGVSALFVALLLLFGLSVKIIPPVKTWKYTIQIWSADRNTNEGDSVYLACMNQKADIFEKKSHNKRALNARKKILDYYIDKGDTLSVDYAIAKYKNFLAKEDGLYLKLNDVEGILQKAWKNNLLNDEEKDALCALLLAHTHYGIIIHKEDEPIYVQVLDIVESMPHSSTQEYIKVTVLTALLTIYMRDLQDIDKVTHYVTLLKSSICQERVAMVMKWLLLTQYYLLTHNTIEAQVCLDAAKDIKYKDRDITLIITELQKAIYEANGDVRKAINERRHIVALDNSSAHKHLVRWKNAINLSRKFQANCYSVIVEADTKTVSDRLLSKDSLTYDEKIAINQYRIQVAKLVVEHILQFTDDDPTPILMDLAQWRPLSPNDQLDIINLSIRTSLKCPSDSSRILLQDGVDALQKRLQFTFPHFTDGEKSSFWMAEEPIIRQIYAVDNSSDIKYNIALLSKGLLLESSNNIRRSIMESQDSSLIGDWRQLQVLRQAELLNIEQSKQNLYDISSRADSLERSISQRSTAYQHFKNTWDITWTDVQSKLGEDECAVEIVSYPIPDDIQYDALIVRKQDSLPICVHIGKESSYKDVGATALFTARSFLIDTIWSPIQPYVQSGNIYISMDGWFHHHNIEAMVADDAGNLLSDKYTIVRVSSTRDLVQSTNLSMENASLFGGVKYDLTNVEPKESNPLVDSESTNRGIIWNKKRGVKPFTDLPYSLVEVQKIASLLNSQGCDTAVYVRNNASEEAFKAISGRGTKILHVSTHGIADQISDGAADPMRYCCLLLAGANNALSEDSHINWAQDGILTASEISTLDFRGMELVVLSACNTAGGEVTSDGVFGLQRAFKQAGAQSILMSLSSVNDSITAQFMVEYYKQMTKGDDKRKALNCAREIIRETHPESNDWAAFILLD